jgi:hypothetical protein
MNDARYGSSAAITRLYTANVAGGVRDAPGISSAACRARWPASTQATRRSSSIDDAWALLTDLLLFHVEGRQRSHEEAMAEALHRRSRY